nr:MAG TPA: hypothetical protein [Caudoviricetes sp.]DAS53932.1 MAG TPA: hypothetical protein [Caudoviricetes sp.]DAW50405.1 MAG TPA: hypothetical protein [Caudoviricetes sp.]DAX66522.1 MAG TPA: hypothetical protein [Caudoviricetes sp.]DAY13431.1 MAG TPA: hypothetical protein [Caudoviricetes sp.]
MSMKIAAFASGQHLSAFILRHLFACTNTA